MQTKSVFSAILATIAYLEAVQGAPLAPISDAITVPSVSDQVLNAELQSEISNAVAKRKTSAGSIVTSALKSGGLSALESGAEDLWDDLTNSDDSSSANAKRKTSAGSIVTSALKSGGLSALESGAEDLWDDLTNSDDSASSKRSLVSTVVKEIPTVAETIEDLIDGDSSSSSKRSWASLLDKAEPYVASGAESLAKTVGGAVGSEVVSAGQSLASDVGLSRRKINWGNIIESGATSGATTLGDGLGSTVAGGVEALASDVGINIKERSTTFDAELPKRTGILKDIEHGIEDFAPIAIGALADAKRDTAVPRSLMDEFESFLSNLKTKRDTTVPRSFVDELESFLGNL